MTYEVSGQIAEHQLSRGSADILLRGLSVGVAISDGQLLREALTSLEDLGVRVLFGAQTGAPENCIPDINAFLPNAVLVQLTASCDIKKIIRAAKAARPDCAVIVVASRGDAEAVVQCFRAGAADFIYPPFASQLRVALHRLQSDQPESAGKVAGWLSVKGGCGATTIACYVARALHAMESGRVLLADLDFAAGQVGFISRSDSPYTIADALANTHRLDASYWRAVVSDWSGLDVLPAPAATAQTEPVIPSDVAEVLQFWRSHYKWTCVDLGRGLDRFILSIAPGFDELFLVSTVELPALARTRVLATQLLDLGLDESRIRVVLNRTPKDWEVRSQELEKLLGLRVIAEVPSVYRELHDTHLDGKLLPQRSRLGQHFASLAHRIAGVPESGKEKSGWLGKLMRSQKAEARTGCEKLESAPTLQEA